MNVDDDKGVDAAGFLEPVDGRYVGMCQGREGLRFALKACEAFRVSGDVRGQHFHRHVALQLRVRRPINLPHPVLADLGGNLMRAEAGAGS